MTNEKFEDPFVDLDEDKSTMDKDQHVINLVIICYVSLFFLSCFYNKIFYQ